MACPVCSSDPLVIRWQNADGSYTVAPVEDNIVTIPNPAEQTPWEGINGNGIEIIEGGTDGHGPTIEVCLDPSAENAVAFRDGCLFVASADASPDLESQNIQTTGGIRTILSGPQGHVMLHQIVVAADSPVSASFNSSGELVLECCDDISFLPSSGENVSIQAGDNPGGASGNGHRPTISMRNGAGLCAPLEFRCTFNALGEATLEVVNPTTGGSLTIGGPF